MAIQDQDEGQDSKLGTREHFLRVTQLQRWGTIQEYVDLCRAQGYFTPAFYATAIAHMKRIHVRRRRPPCCGWLAR
jgi:hypothetical protein